MTAVAIGDYGVVPMGGDSGKLIRFGQWLNGDGFTNYEHAFIFVGEGQIVEAEPGGARLTNLHYDNVLWSSDHFDLTLEQRVKIVHAAKGFIGTPYSAMDYFALAAYRLKFGLLVPYLHRYVASTGHMICSQLVDAAYSAADVHLFKDGRWPGYVTPGALAELIEGKTA